MGDLIDLGAERLKRRGVGFASKPAFLFPPMPVEPAAPPTLEQVRRDFEHARAQIAGDYPRTSIALREAEGYLERSLPPGWQPVLVLGDEDALDVMREAGIDTRIADEAPTVAEQVLAAAERSLERRGRSTTPIRDLRRRLGL